MIQALIIVTLIVVAVVLFGLRPVARNSGAITGSRGSRAVRPTGLDARSTAPTTCLDLNDFLAYSDAFDLEAVAGTGLPWIKFTDSSNSNRKSSNLRRRSKLAQYSCRAVFEQKEESESIWPPPNLDEIEARNPTYLSDVTYGGRVPVTKFYKAKRHNHNPAAGLWDAAEVDRLASQPSTCGFYKSDVCELTFSRYSSAIAEKRGLVIGSLHPWVEGAVLRQHARHVTTVEYLPIRTNHPQLTTMTPEVAAQRYLNGTLGAATSSRSKSHLFDFIVTFSSLEHDGLGRYGDPLNAHGDLMSLAKARCLLHPQGMLFLGLPVGPDSLQFNAHRVYGYLQLSAVLSLGFELRDIVFSAGRNFTIQRGRGKSWGDFQPILVLQKAAD